MRKQRIDLEGAHQPALDPLLRRQRGDVGAVERDASGVRPQHPGHQIDQRRLAGAVRADQRVARAGRQCQFDVGGDDQRAEAFAQAAGGQRDLAHGLSFRRDESRDSPPRMPPGNSITTAIKISPIQKYQYCGLSPDN